jgi:mxaK protein
MGLATSRRTRIAFGALAALLLVAGIDGARTSHLRQLNALVRSGHVPAPAAAAAPELQFAQAHELAASGAVDAALKRYQALQGEERLGQAARFNSANLLLREAMRVREGPEPGQAIALIELAKELYREVLRKDPGHWDARYNLERAQRLLPDPVEADDAPAEEPRKAERAATTMRGFSPGLP